MAEIDKAVAAAERGETGSVYLVVGDRVVAEPAAVRLGQALAATFECELDIVRRPESLTPVLNDLRTLALFTPGKVTLVVESALLADAGTAASLLDEAIDALPLASAESDLGPRERRAAACLLQGLRLYQLDPYAGAVSEVLAELPKTALEGGPSYRKKSRRRRGAKQIAAARESLAVLLEAARLADIQGIGESEEQILGEVARDGLPQSHALILAESVWAESHPLVTTLREQQSVVETGRVSADRRAGWVGLELVCEELERETGVGIAGPALKELARRTLRKKPMRGGADTVDSESTARFAAEYRKLANLAQGSRISAELVADVTQDRGEEDVWGVLDAIGQGEPGKAIAGIDRLLLGAEDLIGTRLSLFSLLASFCRQLTAVSGIVRSSGLSAHERSYPRFKDRIAPRLQGELPGGGKNPLAGLHPYRLHRVYLAASRLSTEGVAGLPGRVLETEKRLKGGSVSPDAVLAALVADLAIEIGGRRRRA